MTAPRSPFDSAAKQPGAKDSTPLLSDAKAPSLAGCILYARCEPCMYGQCPGGEHRWAGQEDIDHAVKIGDPDSALGRCACPCYDGPELDEAPEPDEIERVSIDGPPCHLCGAAGACGYDAEGRPYIHASWDEDETEMVQ